MLSHRNFGGFILETAFVDLIKIQHKLINSKCFLVKFKIDIRISDIRFALLKFCNAFSLD
jgi:hypothetical protein